MMTNKLKISIVIGSVFIAANAAAQEKTGIAKYGLSLTAGAGVTGFTESDMRDTSTVGGLWDVRAAVGTRYPVGLELGYRGSAQAIDAIGLDTDAILLGTSVEGVARVNFLPTDIVTPYAFLGVAWQRYDITRADTNTSDITDNDTLFEVPMGLGLGYRYQGFLADVRGEFRAATGEDLVPSPTGGTDHVAMHSWGASARLGYEF